MHWANRKKKCLTCDDGVAPVHALHSVTINQSWLANVSRRQCAHLDKRGYKKDNSSDKKMWRMDFSRDAHKVENGRRDHKNIAIGAEQGVFDVTRPFFVV